MAAQSPLLTSKEEKATVTTRKPVINSSANFSSRKIAPTGAHSYRACHLSFKVVLAGEVDVGKTTLFNRLKSEGEQPAAAERMRSVTSAYATQSSGNHLRPGGYGSSAGSATHQTESRIPVQLSNGELAELTLVDTAGEERFNQTLTGSHYRNADLVLFVYDVSCDLSLHALKHWVQQARAGAVNREGLLLGNKTDIRSTAGVACVPAASVEEFAGAMGLTLAEETCALNGDGVGSLLKQITAHFSAHCKSRASSLYRGTSSNGSGSAQGSKCACCTIL